MLVNLRRFMVFSSIFVLCLGFTFYLIGLEVPASSLERALLKIKVLATILYYSGLSLRDIESIVGYSRKSVRRWYRIISEALPRL